MVDTSTSRQIVLLLCATVMPMRSLTAQRDVARSAETPVDLGDSGNATFCGDLSGDGHDDFAALDASGWTGLGHGSVFFYSGADSTKLQSYFEPDPLKRIVAYKIDTLGDYDGDGFRDFITATDTPFGSNQNHTIRVRTYPSGSQIVEISTSDAYVGFGRNFCTIGDVNSDGVPDLAISSPYLQSAPNKFAGRVEIFDGSAGTRLSGMNGLNSEQFGSDVIAIGDVNGDGVPDLVATAPGAGFDPIDNEAIGGLRVLSGSDASLLGQLAGADATISIANVGDVDLDGFNDLAVGAWEIAADQNAVMLFKMQLPAFHVLQQIVGPIGTGRFVTGPGDIDSDGVPDVASYRMTTDAAMQRVLAHSGRTGEQLWERMPSSNTQFLSQTQFMASGGDLNGDGRGDVLVGTWEIPGSQDRGIVGLSGTCGKWITIGHPCPTSGTFVPAFNIQSDACLTPNAYEGFDFTITNFPGASTALLVIGASSVDIPVGNGCSLYVGGPLNITPISLGLFGLVTPITTGKLPVDLPLGDLTMQVFTGSGSTLRSTAGMKLEIR